MEKASVGSNSSGIRSKIQSFGRFLSGMVMPNIGAFIAWGLITTIFIPVGWIPNEKIATLVGPILNYLLPLLIGYTAGKMVHGVRGGVVGAVATMGVILGSPIPMLLGAMILGPLGGWCIKQFDKLVKSKIKAGFEMLVDTFSAGIIGGALAILALIVIGPVVTSVSEALGAAVNAVVATKLTPLTAIIIEPAKILFLNNAINHGVLTPLGAAQAAEVGKSILFMLETNPGPGLGVLLAYWLFAKGMIKDSAPGAILIHLFGGIHEIYFPYILMKPILLLAVIAGGAAGSLIFTILGAGLVASPAPGSILAYLAMTPRGFGNYASMLCGVAGATIVSFLVASIFIKKDANQFVDADLENATATMVDLKGKPATVSAGAPSKGVKKVYFACDAGMGSSAMGATTLQKLLKKAGLNIDVEHCAVNEVPADAQVVVTHKSLTERAKGIAPKAFHYSITNFMSADEYTGLIEKLK